MVKLKKYFFLVLLLLSFITEWSCSSYKEFSTIIRNKEDFFYYLNANLSSKINFNGYYYMEDSAWCYFDYKQIGSTYKPQDSIKMKAIRTLCLYQNGMAFVEYNSLFTGLNYGSIHQRKDIEVSKNTYKEAHEKWKEYILAYDSIDYRNKKSGIWNWGAYIISGDTIKVQFFTNVVGNYQLDEIKGVIKNNMQIDFFSYQTYGKEIGYNKNTPDKTFIFYNYAYKPDSTNNYLKRLMDTHKTVR